MAVQIIPHNEYSLDWIDDIKSILNGEYKETPSKFIQEITDYGLYKIEDHYKLDMSSYTGHVTLFGSYTELSKLYFMISVIKPNNLVITNKKHYHQQAQLYNVNCSNLRFINYIHKVIENILDDKTPKILISNWDICYKLRLFDIELQSNHGDKAVISSVDESLLKKLKYLLETSYPKKAVTVYGESEYFNRKLTNFINSRLDNEDGISHPEIGRLSSRIYATNEITCNDIIGNEVIIKCNDYNITKVKSILDKHDNSIIPDGYSIDGYRIDGFCVDDEFVYNIIAPSAYQYKNTITTVIKHAILSMHQHPQLVEIIIQSGYNKIVVYYSTIVFLSDTLPNITVEMGFDFDMPSIIMNLKNHFEVVNYYKNIIIDSDNGYGANIIRGICSTLIENNDLTEKDNEVLSELTWKFDKNLIIYWNGSSYTIFAENNILPYILDKLNNYHQGCFVINKEIYFSHIFPKIKQFLGFVSSIDTDLGDTVRIKCKSKKFTKYNANWKINITDTVTLTFELVEA